MFTQSQSFRMSRFGQSGVVLRAKGSDVLTPEIIQGSVPSVFAETSGHGKRGIFPNGGKTGRK